MAEDQNIHLAFSDENDPVFSQLIESQLHSQHPADPRMEELNYLKKRDELLRQNILICLSALGMGNPIGGELNRTIDYCIDDEINRGIIKRRTLEFIKQLSNYSNERTA